MPPRRIVSPPRHDHGYAGRRYARAASAHSAGGFADGTGPNLSSMNDAVAYSALNDDGFDTENSAGVVNALVTVAGNDKFIPSLRRSVVPHNET